MSNEKGCCIPRRTFLKGIAYGLAGIIAAQPLRDLKNTGRVLEVLAGKNIDCFDESEMGISNYPYDGIVVLGGGMDQTSNGKHIPSDLQKLRLEAAAISFITKKASKVILLDGKIEDGIDPQIDVKYLQREVKRLSNGTMDLPESSIIVDKKSVNTSTNLEEYAQITKNNNLKSALMITNFFHLPRGELLSCNFDVNVDPKSAEDIIIEFDPSRKIVLETFYQSIRLDDLLFKEQMGITEIIFDRRQKLPTLWK